MSNHTPGPWLICDDGINVYASKTDTAITNVEHPCAADPDVQTANAHLIAASPALLDAAKQALDWLNADERTAWAKPSREYIATLLDAAIAAADPDFVC